MAFKSRFPQVLVLILNFIFVIFFAVRPAAASAGNQASFVRTDTTTQGNWQGVYGANGYVIADSNASQPPAYAVLTPQNQSNWVWTSTGTEVRDLQTPGSSLRQAGCWYSPASNSFGLDVNITDGNSHQIALYALDWDRGGRAETIQVVDGASGAVLDTRSAANFTNGAYYIWSVSGHVKFNVTRTSGLNAVISGAFFDAPPAPATAQFVNTDTTTEGNWVGAYGSDGYDMMGVNPVMPSYAALTPQNDLTWTWAGSSTDPRALEMASGPGRIAATWYNSSTPTFTIDVNTTDGNSHQVALYAVDWDNRGRAETIQVVDAQTNTVLDSRSIFNFTNGIYAVWNVSGHVKFNVTSTGGPNAAISAAFFGRGGSVPTAAPPVTSSTTNTSSSTSSTSSITSNNSTSTTSGSSTTTTTVTLPSGLVLHWTFDTANISATTVADTSNNGGTGTMNGSPAVVDGKINQALSFNGVNSYVSMSAYSDIPTFFNNSVTLAAWIKTTNATRTESIISKYSAGGSAAGYIFKTDSAGHLEFTVGGVDISSYPGWAIDTATVNDGQWHHVAVVVTMGQGVQFYVDGTPTSSTKMSLLDGGDAGADLEVGACNYPPYAAYFTGTIDDVQLYNRALSAAEIGTAYSYAGGSQSQSSSTTSSSTSSSTTTTTPTTTQTTTSGSGTTSGGSTSAPAQTTINAVSFNGIDTTTQGAWKGVGNFNAPPASSSLVYGKDGLILPDTEGCDTACNPFPSYVSFGPQLVNSATPGNVGAKPNSTHAYVDLVQGSSAAMGPEPQNATNTKFFQCNYTFSNPAAPWALMVAWRPVVDTREISAWYTCSGITSFYLEFSFGQSTHNFEVYVQDDTTTGAYRSEELQILDGDTNAVLYDSGSFTNFTGGVYYKWSITGHVKVKVINTGTNGTNAVINAVFFN